MDKIRWPKKAHRCGHRSSGVFNFMLLVGRLKQTVGLHVIIEFVCNRRMQASGCIRMGRGRAVNGKVDLGEATVHSIIGQMRVHRQKRVERTLPSTTYSSVAVCEAHTWRRGRTAKTSGAALRADHKHSNICFLPLILAVASVVLQTTMVLLLAVLKWSVLLLLTWLTFGADAQNAPVAALSAFTS